MVHIYEDFYHILPIRVKVTLGKFQEHALSIISVVVNVMHETQLTKKLVSNQAAFCWSAWRIHIIRIRALLNQMQNLRRGNLSPSCITGFYHENGKG